MNEGTDSIPTKSSDLDVKHLLGMVDVEVGEEVWMPVTPIRGNRFRAVKVIVEDRISVNNYEEHHAIEKWPQDDRHPISHERSEGVGSDINGGSEE